MDNNPNDFQDCDKADLSSQAEYSFGWELFEFKIHDEILQELIDITDKVLNDKENSQSHNPALAGRIESEFTITHEMMGDKIIDYFTQVLEAYAQFQINTINSKRYDMLPEELDVDWNTVEPYIEGAWVNQMYKYEYNPVHSHVNAMLSSVLFLKVPDLDSSNIGNGDVNKPNREKKDGWISFVDCNHQFCEENDCGDTKVARTKSIKPEPGMFYLFPASLLHTVYPFDCEGERRSFAFNVLFRHKENNG